MQKHKQHSIDNQLMDAFEKSLAEAIGPASARAFIINEQLLRDQFDPQALDASLTRVFGVSNSGVNLVRRQVLNRFSSSLNLSEEQGSSPKGESLSSSETDFVSSIKEIASRYRVLNAPPKLTSSGIIAAFVSSVCCLSPLVLALLGLASFSAAASLGMSLTAAFKPIELTAGFGLMGAVVFLQLRKERACNLSGLRRRLGYVLVPIATMLIVYAFVNYLLGTYFIGSFNLGDLLP